MGTTGRGAAVPLGFADGDVDVDVDDADDGDGDVDAQVGIGKELERVRGGGMLHPPVLPSPPLASLSPLSLSLSWSLAEKASSLVDAIDEDVDKEGGAGDGDVVGCTGLTDGADRARMSVM